MKINIDYHGANLFICKKCQYARTKRLVASGEDCVRNLMDYEKIKMELRLSIKKKKELKCDNLRIDYKKKMKKQKFDQAFVIANQIIKLKREIEENDNIKD